MTPRRPLRPTLLLLLAACEFQAEGDREGVAVGNPTKGYTPPSSSTSLSTRVALGSDVAHLSGDVPVAEIRLVGCREASVTLARDVVLSAQGDSELLLPAGVACGLDLVFSGALFLEGGFARGSTFTLELDVGRLTLRGDGFRTHEHDLVLQLGAPGWLTSNGIGGGRQEHLDVGPGHPRHDALARQLRAKSLLFADRDGDGLLGDDDVVLAEGIGR